MKNAKKASLSGLAHCFFPSEIIRDSSSSCGEKGKRFAISKSREESVITCELKSWRAPIGQKTCDCVFLGHSPGREEFVLVLVELKGKRVDTALEQIEATFRLLCKTTLPTESSIGHGKTVHTREAASAFGYKHPRYSLGVIVAPGGGREFDRRQTVRARLFNTYGLKIILANTANHVIELSELVKEANPRNP